jgi:hypothetical protein
VNQQKTNIEAMWMQNSAGKRWESMLRTRKMCAENDTQERLDAIVGCGYWGVTVFRSSIAHALVGLLDRAWMHRL